MRTNVGRRYAIAVLFLVVLWPHPAMANGKFPSAGQVAVDPGNPLHLTVRTTFGLLVSQDGGKSFGWICESGAGYGGGYDPWLAVTGDGSVIAGTLTGLSVSHGDACIWASLPELAGEFVGDVSVLRSNPSTALALDIGSGAADRVWISTDNGWTFAPAAADLPADFHGYTVDMAPSDPTRIYVGGTRFTAGIGYRAATARSDDGGGSWQVLELPDASSGTDLMLSAVDPSNPDVLYARPGVTPGTVMVSKDGAQSWTTVFTGKGALKAFALSPDGSTVLVGGLDDGVWTAPAATLVFEPISSIAVLGLTWAGDKVYACANEFVAGVSSDSGKTFEPLVYLECLHGPLECDPATPVGSQCPSQWPLIANQIGLTSCEADAGADGGNPDGGNSDGGHASPPDAGATGRGCGCRVGATDSNAAAVAWFALGWLLTRRRFGARSLVTGVKGNCASCSRALRLH